MARVNSLQRDISPPPLKKTRPKPKSTIATTSAVESDRNETVRQGANAAAIEAGQVEILDHLAYFSRHLAAVARPTDGPRMTIEQFRSLYTRNQSSRGRHFVIHQHDHPVAGVHYDLRLQFSETSTISFAIPYGLPLNPNSQRPNRMAIETRVHNVWNNLIESASHATGSLLIWETGEYEILPREHRQHVTDDELSDVEGDLDETVESQSQRLFKAFQSRHIRLRLHGARLPRGCTVSLRLPLANDRRTQPSTPKRKRKRSEPAKTASVALSDSDDDAQLVEEAHGPDDVEDVPDVDLAVGLASDDEENDIIRANNAYVGATNTIGSVHQRHWFLTLDRPNSGFRKVGHGPDAGRWTGEWDAIIVRGRDHERSIVTGRLADEVMADAGVEKFCGRKMWRPITE